MRCSTDLKYKRDMKYKKDSSKINPIDFSIEDSTEFDGIMQVANQKYSTQQNSPRNLTAFQTM
jgi:hypothetical protein